MPFAGNGSVRLHYRDAGSRDGEPVLLIMGFGGSGNMWWRLEPHLAQRYRLLLIDNRGTGDSDPARGPLSMRDLAADAVAVLDSAGVERAHVVGASMGGMVAQHVALAHRERVASAVLACTSAGGPSAPNWRLMAASALRPLVGPGGTFGIVAPALYSERARREHPHRVREDLRKRTEDATPASTLYAQMAAIARHDTRARLRELGGVPVLVLHGSDDSLVPVQRGLALAAGIPGARYVELDGAGHVLTTDAEDAVAGAILEHLDRATAALAGR